jgi:hypothetical protein
MNVGGLSTDFNMDDVFSDAFYVGNISIHDSANTSYIILHTLAPLTLLCLSSADSRSS